MRKTLSFAVATVFALIANDSRAENLIYQLPEDGSWVRFDAQGFAIGSDGAVRVTVKGTLTLSSVGRATIDGKPCRWIEVATKMKFKRGDREGEATDVHKLLIPEAFLTKGQNPRDHVLKAWKKTQKQPARQLDLKGQGARDVQSLDEIFSGPLPMMKKLKTKLIKSKLGKLKCEGSSGREVQAGGTVFTTETRLHKKSPFGVVTFYYQKQRPDKSARTMTFRLADYGKNAKTKIPESR